MACVSAAVGEIYKDEKDDDGFLYVVYASQEMFGWVLCIAAERFVGSLGIGQIFRRLSGMDVFIPLKSNFIFRRAHNLLL